MRFSADFAYVKRYIAGLSPNAVGNAFSGKTHACVTDYIQKFIKNKRNYFLGTVCFDLYTPVNKPIYSYDFIIF